MDAWCELPCGGQPDAALCDNLWRNSASLPELANTKHWGYQRVCEHRRAGTRLTVTSAQAMLEKVIREFNDPRFSRAGCR
jgi:hypothetical protein